MANPLAPTVVGGTLSDEIGLGYDELSGWPSRELGVDPIIRRRGSNQFLRGNSHADYSPDTSQANRVQAGALPIVKDRPIGAPTPINPGGARLATDTLE